MGCLVLISGGRAIRHPSSGLVHDLMEKTWKGTGINSWEPGGLFFLRCNDGNVNVPKRVPLARRCIVGS
jgi:hypothetical protein